MEWSERHASGTSLPTNPLLHQPVFDGTSAGDAPISNATAWPLGPGTWFGLSFYLPEADPACGAGSYRLEVVSIALSLNESLPGGLLPLTLLLYAADPASGAPITTGSYLRVSFSTAGPITATPAYFSIDLPSSWILDATAQRWYSLVLYSTGGHSANWLSVGSGGAPATGFGTPLGAWTSPTGGVAWGSTGSAWPGVALLAQKTVCSPTPTQSATTSPTATPTRSQSPSPSGSITGPTFFDGTAVLSYGIGEGAGAVGALNVSTWTAVAFAVNETDPGCGPGRWSLTQLWLPLSQVADGAAIVSVRVQLFTADVSAAHGDKTEH